MRNLLIILILFGIGWSILYAFSGNRLRERIGTRFVLSFIAVTAAGFYSPGLPIFFIVMFAVFIASARGRGAALSQYILLSGLVVQVPYGLAIAGHYLGFIGPLTVLALGAYLIARFSGPPPAYLRVGTKEDALVFVTFLIMAIGGYGFPDLFTSLRAISGQIFLIVVPYLVIRYAVRSGLDYRDLIACFGASAFLLSVFALYEHHYGWSIFEAINYHLGSAETSKNMLKRAGALRAPATMSGPLALACYLTVGIIALACSRSYFKSRLGFYAIISITLLGLLAAQSRGSLPALAAAVVMLFIARRRYGAAIGICAAGVAAGLALFAIADVSPTVAAFLNVDQPKQFGAYYDYRQVLFNRGVEEALKHPILGMRLQPALDALSDIQQGQHIVDLVNIYLVIFLISGFLGLISFVVLLTLSLFGAVARFKGVNDLEVLQIRAFSIAAMVALLIQFSFMSFIDRIPMNFVMVLAGIRLAKIERSRLAARKGQPSNDAVQTSGQPATSGDLLAVPGLSPVRAMILADRAAAAARKGRLPPAGTA